MAEKTVNRDHEHHDSGLHDVCNGRLSPLDAAEVSERLTALPTWVIVDGQLSQTFKFENFEQSIGFVNTIAAIAAAINHHPDICVLNKRAVRVSLWTRKMACLLELDFELAESIDAAYTTEFGDRMAP